MLTHLAVLPLSLFSHRHTSIPCFSISVTTSLLPGDLYPDLQPLWINLPIFYLLHDAFSDYSIWKYFFLSLHLHSTLSVTLLWHLYFPSWIVNIFISKSEVFEGGLHIHNWPTFPLLYIVYHSAMWMVNRCLWVKEIL